MKQWIEAYPDAASYACPGLKEKEPDIPFKYTIGGEEGTPAGWPDEVHSYASASGA